MSDPKLVRWQAITLGTLFTGYVGYYLCRSNLSIATPLILREYADQGFTKETIGVVASTSVFFYAIGKVTNGLATDFLGGRLMFLLGIFASIGCTVLFGFAQTLTGFVVLWSINRYVQSAGWGALVKVASRWFPVHRHGFAMGFLSMSYLLGDALARWYLGAAIGPEIGLDWRQMFLLAAATFLVIGVASLFLLKPSPQSVGCEEPAANPDNLYGDAGEQDRPAGLLSLIGPLLRSPVFWLICFVNFGLTLIRETFNFWTPTFLNEVAGLSDSDAGKYSLVFPLVGAASVLLAGLATDRLRGKHWHIIIPALGFVIGALLVIGSVPLEGRPILALCLIAAVSFFLIAPYSFLSGIMALGLGGKQGSSTAAGLIDSAGYLGAVVSGWGIGKIAETRGWGAAFLFLAGVAAITAVAAIAYWIWDRYNQRSAATSRETAA